jgi:DNA polymerase-3 subunit epsilon
MTALLGLQAVPEDTLLVGRAMDFLAPGPAEAQVLISAICQIPNAPRPVAEHLAATLLGGRREFERQPDGRWRLLPRHEWRRAESQLPARSAPAGAAPTVASSDRLDRLSYVVVDVETTGGRPGSGDRITEVAAVVVRDGEVQDVYETLINPQRSIPPMITSITNISWSMVKDAPVFADVCATLVERLSGHVFVAHNASFDWRFVSAEVARASGQRLEGRTLCTVRLARKLLPQLPRRNLDSVAHYYGVEIGARHRAAGDALATAHVLLGLLRDSAQRGVTTWAELDRFLSGGTAAAKRRRRPAFPHPIDKDTTA